MMTYDKIIRSLFSGEAGERIPTGVSYSYPVPTKDSQGNLVDSFFLYSVNHTTKRPSVPHTHIGIYAETGAIAYQRKHCPTQAYYKQLSDSILGVTRTTVRPAASMTMQAKKALIADYERLYPQVREFAFSTLLTLEKQDILEAYFHVQRRLFGSQLGDYRQAAPAFYSWMVQLVAPRVSFLELMQTRQVRLSQVKDYLGMAANDAEQQLLLGLNDTEFAFWKRYGNNVLRLILCGRKLHFNPSHFAELDNPAIIAARSYDPNSANRHSHEQRLDEVRQIARDLRAEYNLDLKADLDALAQQLGIQVDRVKMNPDVDGFVQLDCDGEIITINEKARRGYPPRKRFTLAHEIGHVVIPWHTGTTACVTDNPSVTIDQKRLIDSQEQEANVFASELLIPSDWLAAQMRKSEDLAVVLESVRVKSGASVLACLYAMERVLPEGQVICVTSPAMKGWKFFRSPGAHAWESEEQAFAELDKDYPALQEFTKGTYQIRYYRK